MTTWTWNFKILIYLSINLLSSLSPFLSISLSIIYYSLSLSFIFFLSFSLLPSLSTTFFLYLSSYLSFWLSIHLSSTLFIQLCFFFYLSFITFIYFSRYISFYPLNFDFIPLLYLYQICITYVYDEFYYFKCFCKNEFVFF